MMGLYKKTPVQLRSQHGKMIGHNQIEFALPPRSTDEILVSHSPQST